MLGSISWLQFTIFIFLGLVGYYGYVLIRYYGLEMVDWLKSRRGALPVAVAGHDGETIVEESVDESGKEVQPLLNDGSIEEGPVSFQGRQAILFPTKVNKGGDLDLFKVTDTAIGKVTAMLNAAKGSEISLQEIEERLRSVLAAFGELKDTAHQETINQIIERACMHHFNVRFEAERLKKLW